jgi:hypothetical protein
MDTQAPAGDTTSSAVDFESMAIPETYKDTAVSKYKTVGELAKGYTEAQKLIGAKGVIVPSDNADPKEIEKFYNTLGRPEKADGYKLTPSESMHQKLKENPDMEKNFKAMMHKHGLSQKQASGLYTDWVNGLSQGLSKHDEKLVSDRQKAEASLRQEWGADYDTNINKVKTVIDKFGGNGARDSFGDLGNNPVVLKTLANIAKHFSEDTFVKGDNVVPSDVADAQKKLKDIMDDRTHPYWVDGKGHSDAVAEVRRLQEIITPNERVERA